MAGGSEGFTRMEGASFSINFKGGIEKNDLPSEAQVSCDPLPEVSQDKQPSLIRPSSHFVQ